MTKIHVTFISSVTKVQPSFTLPEPIEVGDRPQARAR